MNIIILSSRFVEQKFIMNGLILWLFNFLPSVQYKCKKQYTSYNDFVSQLSPINYIDQLEYSYVL